MIVRLEKLISNCLNFVNNKSVLVTSQLIIEYFFEIKFPSFIFTSSSKFLDIVFLSKSDFFMTSIY